MPDGSSQVDFHSYPGVGLDVLRYERNALDVKSVKLPCGKCVGCKLEKSRQWAIRICHEASFHKHNSFITLTYDPAFLPSDNLLDYSAVQKFLKRLRSRHSDCSIRFYCVGEYGRIHHRPHYHLILFGYDFPDKDIYKYSNGIKLYRSAELESLWPFGFSTIGDVTFESAAYCARYIMKNDGTADKGFSKMSLKPGIGSMFFDLYSDDIYSSDQVFFKRKGKIQHSRPPRYYDKKLEQINPLLYQQIKSNRIDKLVEFNSNELLSQNFINLKKFDKLIRELEDNL